MPAGVCDGPALSYLCCRRGYMKHENRHPVHLSTTLDVKEDFMRCAEWIRNEKITGGTMEVDAADFSYQTDEKLLRQIDEFMK